MISKIAVNPLNKLFSFFYCSFRTLVYNDLNMTQILTDKQKLFIEYFSQTGNATQSAIKAGYSEKTAEQQGYELKNKLENQIDTATKKLLGSAVPMAILKLRKLIENDNTSASVQLGAINSLLDRTGYQTTTKIEDVTGKKTDEELKSELQHLLGTLKVIKYEPDDGSGTLN
jgi:phage terminase small subunit